MDSQAPVPPACCDHPDQTAAPLIQTDGAGALAEDLFCLECGYNLRGLTGDPVRCPECGEMNDLGTAAIPAHLISEALRGMETAPTGCVALAMLFLILSLAGWATFHYTMPPTYFVLSFVCAIGWFIARRRVRKAFENKPGWGRILLDFHLAAALCTLGIPLLIFRAWRSAAVHLPGLLLAIVLAIVVTAFALGLHTYFAARRRLTAMQRETAVRLARDILRRELQRAKK